MSTGVGLRPAQVETSPGDPITVVVDLDNHLPDARQFQVRVVGADTDWAGTPQVTSRLEPGAHTSLELTVTLPLGFPTGEHLLGVEVVPITPEGRPSTDQHQRRVADLTVSVGSLAGLHAVLEPRNVTGRQRARISSLNPRGLVRSRGSGVRRARGGQATVSLRNRGFEPIGVSLTAESPGDELRILLDQTQMVIPPGHVVPVRTRIKARRPWFGRPRRTPFTITAKGTGTAVHLEGSLQRYARIRPGAMKGVGILAVFAVWASTLVFVWDQVVQEETEEVTAEQASDVDDQPGAPATDGGTPGNGGDGAPGNDGDGSEGDGSGEVRDLSVSAAAVEASGQVTAREPQGVRVRIRSVSLVDEISQDATFQASPRGSTSRGVKLLGRRGGVIHNRIVPAEVATSTDDEGRWAVAGLEGPGFFEVRFSKPGYATRAYVVEIPEDGTPISLDTELTAGDGGISGLAIGPDGPMGDVDITVTDGTVTFNTTTPTTGAVGSWSVEGLATPGSYLVTASRRGYGTATQLVRLSGGQSLNGVRMQMQEGTGAITGTVRSNSGPLGDITITATDGETERTTTSLTEGPIGTFSLPELPSPGTYTLTIEGEGWLSQTRDVVLDGGQATANIEMVARTGIAYGRIVDTTGEPLGGVGITAISEDHLYKNTTAPDGRFELVGLEPGSYVIEFLSFEHHTGSSLITIGSGGLREVNLSLQPRDTLEPPPNNSLTFSFSAEGDITVTERTTGDTASTGGGSSASFTNLPAGVRTFDVSGVGFQPATVQFRMGLNGPFSTSVTLKPLVVVDLTVRQRVFQQAPIGGAEVVIRRDDPFACPPTNVSQGCEPFHGTSIDDPNSPDHGKVVDDAGAAPELTDGNWIAYATHADYVDTSQAFTTSYDTSRLTTAEIPMDKLGEIELDVIEPALDPDAPDDIGWSRLHGVTITVEGGPQDGRVFEGRNEANEEVRSPYLLEGLEPGPYRLRLEKSGYRTVTVPSSAIQVSLNHVEERTAVMVLVPDATHGRVVWDANRRAGDPQDLMPIPNANVDVFGIASFEPLLGQAEADEVERTWSTTTDADGLFSFEDEQGPIFGDADVTITGVNASGQYVFNAFDTPEEFVQVPANTDLGDLVLEPRNSTVQVPIQLVHGDAVPVANAAVGVNLEVVSSPDGGPSGSSSHTGATYNHFAHVATFQFNDIPAGNYTFRAWYEPGPDDLNSFTEVTFDVLVLPGRTNPIFVATTQQLEAKGSVSGDVLGLDRLVDPNSATQTTTALEGATVMLLDGDGVELMEIDLGSATSYEFTELDPGTYRIAAERSDYTLDRMPALSNFTVGIGSQVTQDVRFRPFASVTFTVQGQLVDGGVIDPPDDVTVTVTQPGTTGTISAAWIESEQHFEVLGLDEGTAAAGDVTITIESPGYQDRIYILSDTDVSAEGTALGWGEIRDLGTVHLEQLPGVLELTLTSGGGAGIDLNDVANDLVIDLYRIDDIDVLVASVGDFTHADGVWTVGDLPPGDYRLELNAHNHAPLDVPGDGTAITVQGGETVEESIQLANQLNSVRGTVILVVGSGPNATLDDASGVLVELLDAAGDPVLDGNLDPITDTTDSNGDYSIDDVEDGTYQLRVSLDGFESFETTTAFDVDPYVVSGRRRVTLSDITLDALTRDVTITVQSAVGDAAVEGASVTLEPDSQYNDNTAMTPNGDTTDVNGEASFTSVVPGRYTITVDGSTATGAPHRDAVKAFHLEIADAPTVTDTVTIQEALLTGWVQVQIVGGTNPSINGTDVSVNTSQTGGTVIADYTFSGQDATTSLAEFELYVAPASSGYYVEASRVAGNFLPGGAQLGAIASGDTVAASTEVDPLLVVQAAEVTIVAEEANTGTPINDARIRYIDPDTSLAVTVTDGEAGDADGSVNGEVRLDSLRPSTYTFTLLAGTGYPSINSTPTALSSGANADVVLAPVATGSLQVSVTGQGSGSYQVRLTPGATGEASSVHDLSPGKASNQTITGVQTGTYLVEVCRPTFDDCDYIGDSPSVTVHRGANNSVTISLTAVTTTTTTTTVAP